MVAVLTMPAAFAARLKDAVDLDSVRDDLASVVHQALEPAHTSVWVSRRERDGAARPPYGSAASGVVFNRHFAGTVLAIPVRTTQLSQLRSMPAGASDLLQFGGCS